MNITANAAPRRIVLLGEPLLEDRDFPLSLSPEDCRRLVDCVLTEEQKTRLEREHSLAVPLDTPDGHGCRLFATSRGGTLSALITA